jgi:hypothetical protein
LGQINKGAEVGEEEVSRETEDTAQCYAGEFEGARILQEAKTKIDCHAIILSLELE